MTEEYGKTEELMVCGALTPMNHWIYKYKKQPEWFKLFLEMDSHMRILPERRQNRRDVEIELDWYLEQGVKCLTGIEALNYQAHKSYILEEERLYYPPPFTAKNLEFADNIYAEVTVRKLPEETEGSPDEDREKLKVQALDGRLMCKHCKKSVQYSHREARWYCKQCRQFDEWYKNDRDCINLGQCTACKNLGIAGYECWYCTPRVIPELSVSYLKKEIRISRSKGRTNMVDAIPVPRKG